MKRPSRLIWDVIGTHSDLCGDALGRIVTSPVLIHHGGLADRFAISSARIDSTVGIGVDDCIHQASRRGVKAAAITHPKEAAK